MKNFKLVVLSIFFLFVFKSSFCLSQVESLNGPKGGYVYDIEQYGDSLYILQNNQLYTLVDHYWAKSYFFDIEPNIYSFKFYDVFIYLLSDKGLYLFDKSNNKLTSILENENITDFVKIGDTCFVTASAKFYKSIDNCKSFTKIDGIGNLYPNWVRHYKNIYTGTSANIGGMPPSGIGIYMSSDYGENWSIITQKLNSISFNCLLELDSILIVAPKNERLYYTSDNGINWKTFVGFDQKYITTILFDNNKLIAGTEDGKIFISEDLGKSWKQGKVNEFLTNIKKILQFNNKYYLNSPNGVFESDNGYNWSSLNDNLFFCDLIDLNVSKNKLYVTAYLNGFSEYDFDNGIWKKELKLSDNNSYLLCNSKDSIVVVTKYLSNIFYLSKNYGKDWIEIDSLKNYSKNLITNINIDGNYLFFIQNNKLLNFNILENSIKEISFDSINTTIPRGLIKINNEFILLTNRSLYSTQNLSSGWINLNVNLNNASQISNFNNDIYIYTYPNKLEKYNLDSKMITPIVRAQHDTLNELKVYRNYIFALASKDDKLYYSKLDSINWKYLDFDTLRTYVRTFDFYDDNVILGTSNKSVLIQKLDFLSSTSVEEVELLPYFYAYPPFPIPGNNQIKSLIYFEPNVEINKSDIGIYDQNGNKIERDENISIDYLNNYSGYLIWDCKNAPNGIYFIHLKFGETFKTIKVMVNKEK